MILYRRDYFIFAGVIILFVLYGIQIFLSVEYSTEGIELAKIQEEINELKIKNGQLKAQILYESSLTRIEQRAIEAGFRPAEPSDYIYLK